MVRGKIQIHAYVRKNAKTMFGFKMGWFFWFGLVWFGLVFGLVWFGFRFGLVWIMVWFGLDYGLVWFSVWIGLDWFGLAWISLRLVWIKPTQYWIQTTVLLSWFMPKYGHFEFSVFG